MTNLELWFRPAVLLSIWILAAALTLAELGTVEPLLRGRGAEITAAPQAGQRLAEARTQLPRRR